MSYKLCDTNERILLQIVLLSLPCFCSHSGGNVIVTIAGSVCDVQSASETQVICVTNAQPRSQQTKVLLYVGNRGIAKMVNLSLSDQIIRNPILKLVNTVLLEIFLSCCFLPVGLNKSVYSPLTSFINKVCPLTEIWLIGHMTTFQW